MPNYYTQVSAFDALNVAMQATANNIANVNSDGYKAQRVIFESGSNDYGVRVSRIYRDWNPGPAVITNFSELASRSAQEQSVRLYHDTEAAYSVVRGNEIAERQRLEGGSSLLEQELRGFEETASLQAKGYVEASNTELPREFVNLINTELAYSANAAVMRTQEVMTGALIDAVA